MFQTPILFLIFNRPNTTKRVFESIRIVKPSKLYIAADGARKDKLGEDLLCQETRNIIELIDWDCEIKTLFRPENLGCKIAVSSAIDWFFENEEKGIILEDDCLPHPSFFGYCETLLNYYKDDLRIGHIGGDNFQKGIKRGEGSYYFSQYNFIWGWASWRRSWKNYDVKMNSYPDFKANKGLEKIFKRKQEHTFWYQGFDKMFAGLVNSWDFQWTFANWNNNMLSILPNVNLISNIGFGEGSTHTSSSGNNDIENLPIFEIEKNLIHPKELKVNQEADEFAFDLLYKKEHYFVLVLRQIKKKIGLFFVK
ncbi:MAG: nucleotide-diphospho-sugar transferase [Bacteroidia bacterium]